MSGLHGSLISLTSQDTGDQVAVAAGIGATVLTLADVSDFNEVGGGSVLIGALVYGYGAVDMEADTVTLTTPLTAAVAVDDPVLLWDTDSGAVVSEYTAMVLVDGQGDGDPITAVVDHALTPLLAQGVLTSGQSITLTRDGEEYRLTAVHGKTQAGLQRSYAAYYQVGIDNFDGTVTGLEVNRDSTVVRLVAPVQVSVQQSDRATWMPIKASAFTVSSDVSTKTDVCDAPDGLAIIAAAPAASWRYRTDPDDVVRFGPMANDLPETMVTPDPDTGDLGVDLARMVGVLWTAVEQLSARITELEKGA